MNLQKTVPQKYTAYKPQGLYEGVYFASGTNETP